MTIFKVSGFHEDAKYIALDVWQTTISVAILGTSPKLGEMVREHRALPYGSEFRYPPTEAKL